MACCVIADYVRLVRRPVLGHNKCTFSCKFEILENDTNTKYLKLLNFNYSFVLTAMQRKQVSFQEANFQVEKS